MTGWASAVISGALLAAAMTRPEESMPDDETPDLNRAGRQRVAALRAALAVLDGVPDVDTVDLLDVAEYIRAGTRGLPADESTS